MRTATQAGFAKDSWQTPRNARTLRAYMALRNQEIGSRLRELRGQRPQTVVADEIGVAERTYQNWEAGDAKPSYRNLQRLAEYYRVGEDYILTGDGAAPTPATPDMFPPATPAYPPEALEGALAEVLADIKAQLAEQTKVLGEIKGLLKDETQAASTLADVTRRVGDATRSFEQTAAQAGQALRGGAPHPKAKASKRAAKRTPKAAPTRPPNSP